MAKFIAQILQFLFGPSDKAFARRLDELTKQRNEAFLNHLVPIIEKETNNFQAATGLKQPKLGTFVYDRTALKDHEAFKPAKPASGQPGDSSCSYEVRGGPGVIVTKPTPAYAPALPKKQQILNYIRSHSTKGVTAEAVGKAFPAWPYSTISARISELYKSGLIVSVGTANTSSGSLASLFVVPQS